MLEKEYGSLEQRMKASEARLRETYEQWPLRSDVGMGHLNPNHPRSMYAGP